MIRKSKSRRVCISEVEMLGLENHSELVSDGYVLTKSSRIWFSQECRFTLRLVYCHPNPKSTLFPKVTHVIRGMV